MAERWELTEETTLYAGHLRVLRRTFRTDSDQFKEYEVLDQGNVVCVLALTPDRRCILVRQFRPGPQRTLAELPAGFIDQGESPLEAAARELAEETGYSGDLREVAKLPANGYSTEVRHVFVATDCKPGACHSDENEELRVVIVPAAELRSLLQSGGMTVTDAAYAALDDLGLLDEPRHGGG